MNYVDILLILPICIGAWFGFKKGFIIEVFTLLALLTGIYIAIHFSDWTSNLILKNTETEGSYIPIIAFTITFLAIGAMVYFAGKMLEGVVKAMQLNLLNKLIGMILGIIKVVYLLSILLTILEGYDDKGKFIPSTTKDASLLYEPIQKITIQTFPFMKESMLWVDKIKPFKEDNNISTDDLLKLKHTADSLGVTVDDLIELKRKSDSLSLQK
ncbi:MAG: CvpA family protein [Brumimicrobium sp.]|nr:CvpA family protein [Brumimicrobium sp.]